MTKKVFCTLVISFMLFFINGCEQQENVGTSTNPIKMAFMPSANMDKLSQSVTAFKTFLEKDTGYVINTSISPDYVTIVEDFGRKNVDISAINTLGYMLAHDWSGTEAHLKVLRGNGVSTYTGQIIVHQDSNIKDSSQLNGKKFAFTEPYSTTGYILAIRFFQEKGLKIGPTVFAKSHGKVVSMVYNKEVDAGATYYDPPSITGEINDARKEVLAQYPDVTKKVKIFAFTGIVPNNPFAFRKDLPEEIKTKLIGALIKFSGTPEGKTALMESYDITGLESAQDSDYDSVRDLLKNIGKAPEDLIPGGLRIYAKKLNTEMTPP